MILVIGSINLDVILKVRHIPRPGETILADSSKKAPGGKGANQAAAAARLGGDVVFLGCLGDDPQGKRLKAALSKARVNTDYIKIVPGCSSPSAFICVSEKGENAIVVDSGTNTWVTADYIEENEGLFSQAKYCVVQLEIPLSTVAVVKRLCRKHQVKLILNPSPIKGRDKTIVDGADYLVPNEDEAAYLLGLSDFSAADDAMLTAFLQQHHVGTMIVTLGKKGCLLADRSGRVKQFPTIPRRPVDTTGAGDTFLGTLVSMLAEDKTADEAVRMGSAASGLQIMREGAQEAIPSRTEVEAEYIRIRQALA